MRGDLLDAIETVPFQPSVDASLFPLLWIVLLSVGFVLMAAFFIYQVSVPRKERSLAKEFGIAATSSIVLGYGFVYLLLWAGVSL